MTIRFPEPDPAILARRDEIVAGLAPLVAPEALITSEDERRAFETDGLTAYRQMPLAVVLPSTTEEVSKVMAYCHANGVRVVPRGAGTSLAGGAIAQGDAIILGTAKMTKILDLEPVVNKWQTFGWPVIEIDGHSIDQLGKALDQAEATRGRPTLVVAHTVKGKGVSFMENNPEWHGKSPRPAEAIAAIREILGVSEPAWDEYLRTDPTTAALVNELRALEKK